MLKAEQTFKAKEAALIAKKCRLSKD